MRINDFVLFQKSNIILKKMIAICLQNNNDICMFKVQEKGREVMKTFFFFHRKLFTKKRALVFDY